MELDEETREQLGWGDPMRWLALWWSRHRRKIILDEQGRDPLKKRLRERARASRTRSEAYKQRKRARDAMRMATKRSQT